jgi:hypothetical protein
MAGTIAGALMARKGIATACILAGLAGLLFGTLGTIGLYWYAFTRTTPVPG